MTHGERLHVGRVAGVTILYHPQESVPGNVRTYLDDVGILYVWDNSPGTSTRVVEEVRRMDRVVYISEGENTGVAHPMNVAAERASASGYEFLLTMDQDSYATDGMVTTMLAFAGQDPRIGLITPYQLDRHAPLTPPDADVEPVYSVMTSGNLLRLAAHVRVGGFLEKLFIDYVDTEYSLRMQAEGYGVVRVNRAVLSHAEGHYTPRKFFGATVYPSNHPPSRFYYRARNRLYVSRQYRERFPVYVRFLDRMYRHSIVKMLLYETHRFRKMFMACRGLYAYVRGDFSSHPAEHR